MITGIMVIIADYQSFMYHLGVFIFTGRVTNYFLDVIFLYTGSVIFIILGAKILG